MTEQDEFMKQGFEEWLGWRATLDMAESIGYEHGDMVHYTSSKDLDDSALRSMLEAAYSYGAHTMAKLVEDKA